MMKRFRIPVGALILAIYMGVFMTSPAIAGMVGSVFSPGVSSTDAVKAVELQKIQKALENKMVAEKLKAFGLTETEIFAKLNNLSDEDIHTLAQASDRVLAGGDGVGFVIGVLIIVVLVIIILKLLNKEIIIR
jgi:hypothetical protein